MGSRKSLLPLIVLLIALGLGIALLVSHLTREGATIDVEHDPRAEVSEREKVVENTRDLPRPPPAPERGQDPPEKHGPAKSPAADLPQFVRIVGSDGRAVENARLFLVPGEHAGAFLPEFFYFRKNLDRLRSVGLEIFKHAEVTGLQPLEVPQEPGGLFPLADEAFDGYRAFALAKGFRAGSFRPARKPDGITTVPLVRTGSVILEGMDGVGASDVFVEVEDKDCLFAASRFFMVHLREGEGNRLSLNPGKYGFRAIKREHGRERYARGRKPPSTTYISEPPGTTTVLPGKECRVKFDFTPRYPSDEWGKVTVRLMYEGRNVTPKEIFEQALGKGDDPLVARHCNPCVDFREFDDGPIRDHDFFRFARVKTLDFRLRKTQLYSLVFRAHSMKIRIQRWGIFPEGQTIDLNLSRNDFATGKGSIRVKVKSEEPADEINTRIFKQSLRGGSPVGSARGKHAEFTGLEPGRYKVFSELSGRYQLFQPQAREVEVGTGPVDVNLDLTGLHALDLTIVDEADLQDQSHVSPPYSLYFTEIASGEIGRNHTRRVHSKIGGFRKGTHLVSAAVWTDDGLTLSRPVPVELGSGEPAVILEFPAEGRLVDFRVIGGEEYKYAYEARLFDEMDRLWISLGHWDLMQYDSLVLAPGQYRVEFREKNESSGPSVRLDTAAGEKGIGVQWNRSDKTAKLYESRNWGYEEYEEEE
ncbi:MAG: hypothetical protein ACYTFG_14435, partial [Planctomycetota bacterium]